MKINNCHCGGSATCYPTNHDRDEPHKRVHQVECDDCDNSGTPALTMTKAIANWNSANPPRDPGVKGDL